MRIKNKKTNRNRIKLHSALIFLILTIIIMVISSIGSVLNLETSYYTVNKISGELETKVVHINNLFNRTGIQYLISNFRTNFTNFTPLGTLIIGLMGIGVAYKSGFLNTLNKMIASIVPRKTLTFLVVFLGVICSMFYDVGYVILIPLAAILFIDIGRHPSAGICAAFAGITFGYGANVVANSLDSTLIAYTKTATTILDATYKVNTNGNLFFMIASTIAISYVGMIITEKVTIPKLGKYNFEDYQEEINKIPTSTEKKGVIISLLTMLLVSIPIIYCIIPGLPFSGLLLYLKDTRYVDQLFGPNSYFYKGSVFIFSALLMLGGLVYGLRVKSINNNKDFVDGMNYYLKDLSSLLVLIFFAAQFCLIFKQTKIGLFVLSSIVNSINGLKLSGIVLVLITFAIVAVSSILVPSASIKWAVLSPVIVPMFMQSSLTPEFSQVVFRAADSSLKGITPLFTYFVILIGFLQIYTKNKDNTITISKSISLMIPYTVAFTFLWLVLTIIFYFLGVPIGINTNVTL
ncbi:MAG: AbgT family transporter [Bacilli bacterium]|nr:AbgT family transporter [Bacilli bacterium]